MALPTKFKKVLTYTLIASYLSTPLGQIYATSNTTLNAVQDLYLKSFNTTSITPQETIESLKQKKQKITLQVKELSEYEKTQLAFTIAEKTDATLPTHLTQLDKTFLKKMELFFGGENNANHLFGHVNHTITSLGKVALGSMLAQPTFNTQKLKARQAVIKELLDNPELFDALNVLMLTVKDAESETLSYWDQENAVNAELFNKVYFGDKFKWLNKNQTALESLVRLNNVGTTLNTFQLPIMCFAYAALLPYAIDKATGNPDASLLNSCKNAGKQSINLIKFFNIKSSGYDDETSQLLLEKISCATSPEEENYYTQILIQNHQLAEKPFTIQHASQLIDAQLNNKPVSAQNVKWFCGGILGGITALSLGSWVWSAKKAIEEANLHKNIANHLQSKLIGLATCINSAQKLQELITNHPLLSSCFASYNDELVTQQAALSANAKKLIGMLNTTTFKGDASVFSLTGRVLAAHQLMKEVKDELAPMLMLIGKLDAYLSIAKLVKSFEQERVNYCFAEFTNTTKPYLEAYEFWNPFVDINVVVPNTLTMGGDQANNIVLTGPNTGGKSTIIKGIIINVLLAQTFGIAPAKRLVLSPFKVLNCYLNITDDIETGTSLFMAEVKRAKALLNDLESLQAHEFGFTIIDEVFSGTSPKEGEEAAYQFSQKIGKHRNSLNLIATHFPKLTELDNDHLWTNKHVAVEIKEDGKLHRPFKLHEGKTFQSVAMDLLKDEGIFN